MANSLTALFLLAVAALTGPAVGQYTAPECFTPPGNNAFADVIVNLMEKMRPYFYTGIPDYNIPVLDPFGPLPTMTLNISNPNVTLYGDATDTLVHNLGQYIVCQCNVTLGLTQRFHLVVVMPDFIVKGLYVLEGLVDNVLPIFGNGDYTVDAHDFGIQGDAAIDYSIIHDRIQIKDLKIDIFYSNVTIFLENIMGGGELGDTIDQYLTQFATKMLHTVWEQIAPTVETQLQDYLNDALYNVSVSGLLPPQAPAFEENGILLS